MAGNALNPPPGSNNLLALVLERANQGRGDVNYADTGETTGTTVSATATLQVNFPLNGVGQQPSIEQGAIGIIIGSVSAGAQIGPISIFAVDTTATSGGDAELVAQFPQVPAAGDTMCRVDSWASSLAAVQDAASSLTNVVGLRCVVGYSGSNGAVVKIVAAGGP